jgi:LysM repeat protein
MLQPTEACVLNTEWQARYTIVSGDRVSVIAERYNLTTTQLAAANCLTNPDRISVGQVLIVPDGVVTAAAPSAIPLITPDADGFTTYVNRDYGFSLRYPPGWNRVEPGAYINLVSPDGSSVVEILIGDTATSPEAQAEACLAGQGCPRGAALESQPFEVNGLPAHRIDLGEAGSLRVIVFLTLNGRDLAIRGFGDAAAFDQILATFTAVR